jgi:hypothetical protein
MFSKTLRDFTTAALSSPGVKVHAEGGAFDAYLLRYCGLEFREGTLVPIAARARQGHPVAVEIQETLRVAKQKYGWGWKECAAAIFVADAYRIKYEFIKKAFQDGQRSPMSRLSKARRRRAQLRGAQP